MSGSFMPPLEHGGALDAAEARWGRPPAGWIDLSTGINPWPYPVPALPEPCWTRLPERTEIAALVAAARGYYGAAAAGAIALAPGSQALIGLLPHLVPRTRVAVLGFTYGEHAHCWRAAGHDVTIVAGHEAANEAGIVIVTQPNNPDGAVQPTETLLALAANLARRDGLLIVDEAFGDVAPESSLAAHAGRPGLLILKSFGKFFGLAGLRLGCALGPPTLIERIAGVFGPWPVSGPALAIAGAALADRSWIAETRTRLESAARDLDRRLVAPGHAPVGGTALFRLIETAQAAALAEHLGRNGILVRRFAERPRWLRFGLPPTPMAAERLSAALAKAAPEVKSAIL